MTALLILAITISGLLMSEGLYLRAHRWRGLSLFNAEPDLFHYVIGFGFFTLYVCKRCLVDAYRMIRDAGRAVVDRDREGHS